MVSATDGVTKATELFAYDGSGQRVQKTVGSLMTVYVYDAFGRLTSEYADAASTASPCLTCYLSVDHLGSTRMVTDQSGNVVARHDFLPFGEEIGAGLAGRNSQWGSTADVTQKFTGKSEIRKRAWISSTPGISGQRWGGLPVLIRGMRARI
jgi:hypothetical protein